METNRNQIIVNGIFRCNDEASVPATSRGLMYGDGCFETFCAYHGFFFKLDDHLERLKKGTHFLEIDYPDELGKGQIESLLKALLVSNDLLDRKAIIRLQIWREGQRGYATDCHRPNYAILASSASLEKSSYQLATVQTRRIPSASLPAHFKFSNGVNYITAANKARKKGADDALMQTVDGWVSETTIANIFWMKNDTVYTPSAECDLLPGIIRKIVLDLLDNTFNKTVRLGKFTVDQLKEADIVWICNSVKEIAPVDKLDETIYQTGTSFQQDLQHCFKAYLERQINLQG